MVETDQNVSNKWPLTESAIERAAEALALACNGGTWNTHYNKDQKDFWRKKVLTNIPA